jgi:glyoxylase-like metal-dependent hydrolase (beta-lactamase superfamily II)
MVKYFRYRNTNCYFLESSIDNSLLAIDAGWPCTLYEYQRALKTIGYSFKNIKWAIVTHFHMDHAGLIGEFIKEGITCYSFENQTLINITEMERVILKNKEYAAYQKIDINKLKTMNINGFNNEIKTLGIDGEAIITKGQSPHSITILTKDHEAILGDLAPINQIMENDKESLENWNSIKQKCAKTIYPSHANIFEI